MMAVAFEYQNRGVGARLKWGQRQRAIEEGRTFIKWTWDPMQARNAHFNLNRLGVTVTSYAENFYGTDYVTDPTATGEAPGIDSDRLFANWQLQSPRVIELADGSAARVVASPDSTIRIPAEWSKLIKQNPVEARQQQLRVRQDFHNAFASGLVCAGFERSAESPRYLLYKAEALENI
jgi:predicted GNAT superfamily acetyltransferase